METLQIGDHVRIEKHKNGYWDGFFRSKVAKVTDKKVGIDVGNGKIKYYSLHNVSKLKNDN